MLRTCHGMEQARASAFERVSAEKSSYRKWGETNRQERQNIERNHEYGATVLRKERVEDC